MESKLPNTKGLSSSGSNNQKINPKNKDSQQISEALLLNDNRFRILYYQSPISVGQFDKTGNLIDVNPSCLSMFGVNNLADLSKFNLFDNPNLSEKHKKTLRRNEMVQYQGVFEFDKVRKLKLFPTKKTGSIWIDVVITSLRDNRENLAGYLAQINDITDRMVAFELIRESEEKYRMLSENASQAIIIAQGNFFQFVNPKACEVYGYSNKELLCIPIPDLIYPKDRKVVLNNYKNRLRGKPTPQNYQFRILRKDKTFRWVEANAVFFTWEGNPATLNFLSDITIRKKAQDELQSTVEKLHQLTNYIEEVRELERLAISRELHDDLGQALTAVIIDLSMIKQKISDTDIVHKIEKVSSLVSNTIKSLQRLTANLRPDMINDLGLDAAIEYYAMEFADRSGMKVSLNIEQGITFNSNTSLNIFRIVQESLTNISRHAKATRVDVMLKKTNNSICVKISDNGKGINEEDLKSKKSFGLMSMIERALSLGGTLDIHQKNKKGTEIKLILPLPKI